MSAVYLDEDPADEAGPGTCPLLLLALKKTKNRLLSTEVQIQRDLKALLWFAAPLNF